MALDLRAALNAISDVVDNRPLPLREYDQIYMKIGDMVVHAEYVARRFADRRIVFVGDGDAIGLAIVHLLKEGVIDYGPAQVMIVDFDERVVNSVKRFAADRDYEDAISAYLYNVIDPVPDGLVAHFDGFHINPPWGQHNRGESVTVFFERAACMTAIGGIGLVVIADDASLPWTEQVLSRTQLTALESGFTIDEMIPALHSYHLDDAPELRSCTLVIHKVGDTDAIGNVRLAAERLDNFYGRSRALRVQYIRELPVLGRGRADERTYRLEPIAEAEHNDV